MMPKNEDDFTDLFDREFEAEAFEEGILAMDRAELPACVLAVLDGADPGPEHWAWMCARRCAEVTRAGTSRGTA